MKIADEVKVALVTAACILSIAIIFKNVLHVQADFIILNSPVYLFVVYIITRDKAKKSKCDRPLYWSLAIIFVTLVTIALYAI
ncbi:MAG: hypothetical protein N2V78_06635 [Methanophagales archaeon]|nr:hypothetical protein [Methanophagales archaeon]MCW3141598.1 hypothetical protein [Methanophagales archaeon]